MRVACNRFRGSNLDDGFRNARCALCYFARPTEESRKHAKHILDVTKEMESAAVLGMSLSSYDTLKADQRKLFARISDEALGEWQHLRVQIRYKGHN